MVIKAGLECSANKTATHEEYSLWVQHYAHRHLRCCECNTLPITAGLFRSLLNLISQRSLVGTVQAHRSYKTKHLCLFYFRCTLFKMLRLLINCLLPKLATESIMCMNNDLNMSPMTRLWVFRRSIVLSNGIRTFIVTHLIDKSQTTETNVFLSPFNKVKRIPVLTEWLSSALCTLKPRCN